MSLMCDNTQTMQYVRYSDLIATLLLLKGMRAYGAGENWIEASAAPYASDEASAAASNFTLHSRRQHVLLTGLV